jgi:hypothetical protein
MRIAMKNGVIRTGRSTYFMNGDIQRASWQVSLFGPFFKLQEVDCQPAAGWQPAPQSSRAATKRRLQPAMDRRTACPTKKIVAVREEIKILEYKAATA